VSERRERLENARARAPPFTRKLCAAAETSRPSIFNPPTDDRKKARRARHIVSERRRFKIPPCLFLPRGPVTFAIPKDDRSRGGRAPFFFSPRILISARSLSRRQRTLLWTRYRFANSPRLHLRTRNRRPLPSRDPLVARPTTNLGGLILDLNPGYRSRHFLAIRSRRFSRCPPMKLLRHGIGCARSSDVAERRVSDVSPIVPLSAVPPLFAFVASGESFVRARSLMLRNFPQHVPALSSGTAINRESREGWSTW